MDTGLERFLDNRKPLIEESAVWGGGTFPLSIKSFLSDEMPPLEHVSSVRCLLFSRESVLMVRNPDGVHIVPGGRIEKREKLDEALRRELLEETGWSITNIVLLGFMHFHPLDPKSQSPDFVQLMYMADADKFIPGAKLSNDYEIESKFCPINEVNAMVPGSQRLYLEAAVKVRQQQG
jgi:8-oxo-dGTP pyrophosphatase MutT (NUDIX family)